MILLFILWKKAISSHPISNQLKSGPLPGYWPGFATGLLLLSSTETSSSLVVTWSEALLLLFSRNRSSSRSQKIPRKIFQKNKKKKIVTIALKPVDCIEHFYQ